MSLFCGRVVMCEPSIHGVPGELLNASNDGLVDAFHTEVADLLKRVAGPLDAVVGVGCRGSERLAAGFAEIPSAFAASKPGESTPDDVSQATMTMIFALRIRARVMHDSPPAQRGRARRGIVLRESAGKLQFDQGRVANSG